LLGDHLRKQDLPSKQEECVKIRTLWRVVLPLYILILAGILLWSATHRHPQLRVTFLDVGQGDSCVIEVTVSGAIIVRRMLV
jgi:beta-lactamase superfamily II metal-dependent hydrolase